MKRKDGKLKKVLSSFGGRKRTSSQENESEATPANNKNKSSPKELFADDQAKTAAPAIEQTKHVGGYQDIQPIRSTVGIDRTEQLELNQAEPSVCRSDEYRKLQSLYGKLEILVLENERLETQNKSLSQAVAEIEEAHRSDNEALQTLKETNEDVFQKFETLKLDFQSQKAALSETESLCRKAKSAVEALEAEKSELQGSNKALLEQTKQLEKENNELHDAKCGSERQAAKLQEEFAVLSYAQASLKDEFGKEKKEREACAERLHQAELQVDHLADVLARKEATLHELQTGEDQVLSSLPRSASQRHLQRMSQLREALERREAATHRCDLATKKETEMRVQLEILKEKLSEQRSEITATLESDWSLRLEEATRTAKHFETESCRLKAEVVGSTMKIQELAHGRDLLEKRVEQLTSAMTSTQICCSLTGISVQTLAELEKIQTLEFERQTAVDDLSELKNKYFNLKKAAVANEECHKVEIERLQGQLFERQDEKNRTESLATQLGHELKLLKERNEKERANAVARVRRLESQLTTLTEKHRKRLESIDIRGTRAMEAMQRRVEEAGALVEERQTLQARWREETVQVAHQLENLAAQHQHEIERFQRHRAAQSSALDKLQKENATLKAVRDSRDSEVDEIKRRLCEALHVKASLEQHLSDFESDYSYLHDAFIQSKQELKKHQELLRQIERERDSYGLRYETIRRKSNLRSRSGDSACSHDA